MANKRKERLSNVLCEYMQNLGCITRCKSKGNCLAIKELIERLEREKYIDFSDEEGEK